MKYEISNIIGDAGEHFFAYKIIETFGWPCRLYGIDLGVDAEIEILDEKNRTTGKLLKVQIKTTNGEFDSKNQTYTIYLDDEHIEYWKNLVVPMIICGIRLENKIIYWKQVDENSIDDTSQGGHKITFTQYHRQN
jgi:hypothetical protein